MADKRREMSESESKGTFTKYADRTHVLNTPSGGRAVMRGGIRL